MRSPELTIDYPAFAAEHFPDEKYGLVHAATFDVFARHHKRKLPDPAEVRQRLQEKGHTRAQLEASSQ